MHQPTDVVALYTLNIQPHLVSLFITGKNVTYTFDDVLLPSERELYVLSYFEIAHYVTQYLVCVFFASKSFICAVFSSLTCNCIRTTYLLAFERRETLFVLCFYLSHNCWAFLLLISRFLNPKCIHWYHTCFLSEPKNAIGTFL